MDKVGQSGECTHAAFIYGGTQMSPVRYMAFKQRPERSSE